MRWFNSAKQYFTDLNCTPADSLFTFLQALDFNNLDFSFAQQAYQMTDSQAGAMSVWLSATNCAAIRCAQIPVAKGGRNTALVVDSSGGQHILYVDRWNHVAYAECLSNCNVLANWTATEILAGELAPVPTPASALQAAPWSHGPRQLSMSARTSNPIPLWVSNQGNLFVSYYESGSSRELKFANCAPIAGNDYCANSGAWTDSVLDSGSGDSVGRDSSLLADPVSGRLHVTYYDADDDSLIYSTCLPQAPDFCTVAPWTHTEVDVGFSNVGQYTSLAYDGTALHVSYYDSDNELVKYSTCIVANNCSIANNWIPSAGWVFLNSYDATTSEIPLQFTVPFEFSKNP